MHHVFIRYLTTAALADTHEALYLHDHEGIIIELAERIGRVG